LVCQKSDEEDEDDDDGLCALVKGGLAKEGMNWVE